MARKGKKAKRDEGVTVALGQANGVHDDVKDEEELALEEAVFGKATTTRTKSASRTSNEQTVAFSDADDDVDDDDDTGLERLEDSNLFFIDDGLGEQGPVASTSKAVSLNEPSTQKSNKKKRVAAWFDPADERLTVSLASVPRLRKLRNTQDEDVIDGLEYESRLRRQFEKMHPTPAWAVEARKKLRKKRERGVDSSDSEEEMEEMMRSTASRTRKLPKGVLAPGEIDIDRLRDANQAEQKSGAIVNIGFSPKAQIMFSTTANRRLRLFQIDGTDNPLLKTLHFTEMPVTTASFHPSGSTILMTGNRPFFVSYNVETGDVARSPRGLLHDGLGGSDRQSTGGMGGLEHAKFSPMGSLLAIGGRRGYVHLVDWGKDGTASAGQVVGHVKMNSTVRDVAWSSDGSKLMTLGHDSEVYVWDVGSRKCLDRWRDEGGFGAVGIESDRVGRWTAVSSNTGIVNLYDESSSQGSHYDGKERKAHKAIENLTTSVTTMRFNHDSQLLALASKTTKDHFKLVHLPTATVYQNWPTQSTPLHHVTCVDFSRKSEYLAVGNQRGKVLLYQLKPFI